MIPPTRVTPDWEEEGLLEGLDDEDARRGRIELLAELHASGVAVEELRQASAEKRLALLPLEGALMGEGERLTLREAAAAAGVDPEVVERFRQAFGLPLPAADERLLTEGDIAGIATTKVFSAAGVDFEQQLDLARVIGRNLAQIAEAMRGVMGRQLSSPEDTERDAGLRFAEMARASVPAIGPLLENILLQHLRAQVRSDVFAFTGAAGAQVTIAFADLVGFTRLGEEVPAEQAGAVGRRLGELAGDVATAPVRLVKLIGDAAMLACRDPEPVVRATLDLVAAADAEGEAFPQIRAGIACGEAVNLGGDWFGRPVNLASRITDRARPGSVLVSEEVQAALAEAGFAFSDAGRKKLKGVRDQPRLFRVRTRETAGQGDGGRVLS